MTCLILTINKGLHHHIQNWHIQSSNFISFCKFSRSILPLQVQMEGFMFVCVYDNGEMVNDPETGVSFASTKTIMICIRRAFGLSQLL